MSRPAKPVDDRFQPKRQAFRLAAFFAQLVVIRVTNEGSRRNCKTSCVTLSVIFGWRTICRMKIFYLICAMLLSAFSVAAQDDSIKNFLRVNKEFCTGGQPSLEHLEKLKADGVKAIVNLRQPTEYAAAEEESKAKVLGFRYFNIPVSPTNPKDEQATEFLKITDDPENRPAFIHCRSAARVAAFWMIRRVLRDGWKIEDAVKEAEKIGLGDHPILSEFARKYIESHRLSPQPS